MKFALFFAFIMAAKAQQSPLWTLGQVIDQALSKNPEHLKAQEKLKEAQAGVFYARSFLFPSVSAVGIAKTQKDAANSSAALFNATAFNAYSVDLKATQPLLQFGILSGVASPQRARDIAELDVEISARNLTSNVIRAFYNLLLIQRYVENLENVQRIEKESLATAQKRQGTGRGQLLDVLQIKTQLALLEPKVAKAKNDASLASATLANYMAMPDLKELRVVGQLDVNSLKDFASKVTFENMNLPEYKQIQMNKEKLEADESAVMGKNYPSVNLFANWGRSSTKKSELFDSNTTRWNYGIEIDIPLFSGLSSIGQRRAFAAKFSQWEQDRKAFEDNQSFNQIQSRQNMKLAEESIQASQEAFKFAEQSLAEAKRNFHYANIDFLQYLSVQKDYLEAASTLDQAKFNYIDALVLFFVHSGQNLRDLAKMLEQRKS